jgi:hypothetical protein
MVVTIIGDIKSISPLVILSCYIFEINLFLRGIDFFCLTHVLSIKTDNQMHVFLFTLYLQSKKKDNINKPSQILFL